MRRLPQIAKSATAAASTITSCRESSIGCSRSTWSCSDRVAPAGPHPGGRDQLPIRLLAKVLSRTTLPGAAERRLHQWVSAGELDPVAVEAVPHAAGPRAERPNLRPVGLTPREIALLCLVARGASNKQIAASLVISEKTARNHVERTYAKIGVSNRIGASMYALRNGLVKNN